MKVEEFVFISYAREDLKIAKQLYRDLKLYGVRPWMDIKDMLVGTCWADTISNAIQNCSYFIALLSSHSVSKKGFVQNEISQAIEESKSRPSSSIFILPVLIDNCEIDDKILKGLHSVDLSDSYEDAFREILRSIGPEVQDNKEFKKAGVLEFYSDRKDDAEKSLEKAFEKHEGGSVLMAGPSLRLFLAPGLHFYDWVGQMLKKHGSSQIILKALSCSPLDNHELPIRSFVEEFNQDGSGPPKVYQIDWEKKIDFCFKKFEAAFFQNHGTNPSKKRCRVIQDLTSTRIGVDALNGVAMASDNIVEHREFRSAPYCTVIIFPDRAYYTPNLLSTEIPVNMPMIVFHKTSHAYKKLVNYFECLWWVSNPNQ